MTDRPATAPVFDDPAALIPLLRPGAQVAGLDVGDRTLGVAVSDGALMLASALGTVRRRKFGRDVQALFDLLGAREVGAWVIGLPVNMDGTEGPQAQSVRAFARHFARLTSAPITLWDERLSSVAAERMLLAADVSRRKRAEVIDHVAAAHILQGALDRMAAARRDRA